MSVIGAARVDRELAESRWHLRGAFDRDDTVDGARLTHEYETRGHRPAVRTYRRATAATIAAAARLAATATRVRIYGAATAAARRVLG